MRKISMEPAGLADAHELALLMREEDKAEVRAFPGVEPLEAVIESIRHSYVAWAVRVDGDLLVVWGLAKTEESGLVLAWLLSSRHVDRYPKTFMRMCRAAVDALHGQAIVAYNAVDARYAKSLRWLERLGFVVTESRHIGINGERFHGVFKRLEV